MSRDLRAQRRSAGEPPSKVRQTNNHRRPNPIDRFVCSLNPSHSLTRSMPAATYIPITGSVLRWAINESGLSDNEFAQKVSSDPAKVQDWIAGQAQPTKTQFNKIVSTLKRPSAAFFLPDPPQHLNLPPPLRQSVGARNRELNAQELREIRWARRLQQLVAHLRAEGASDVPQLPRFAPTDPPNRAARLLRNRLDVPLEVQKRWPSPSAAFSGWRDAVEDTGVLVLILQLGPDAIRGFALWNDAAPLVAVNTTFIPQARAFTLIHEVGHLLLREDAASDEHIGHSASLSTGYTVERWCERMAAAVLLPRPAVRAAVPTGLSADEAYQCAHRLANGFKVSVRAAAIRLMELDLAPNDLYALVVSQSGQLDRPQRKGGGGGRSAAQTRIAQVGRAAARSIVDAVAANRLSERDARDHLRLGGQGFQDFTSLAESSLRRPLQNPVYVIDTSSLINTKRQIKAEHQWDFFNETMTEMVERGDLLIVPQVETEFGRARHPDVPGTWALAKAKLFPDAREPDLETVREVLSDWPKLIDPQGETE